MFSWVLELVHCSIRPSGLDWLLNGADLLVDGLPLLKMAVNPARSDICKIRKETHFLVQRKSEQI